LQPTHPDVGDPGAMTPVELMRTHGGRPQRQLWAPRPEASSCIASQSQRASVSVSESVFVFVFVFEGGQRGRVRLAS